MSHFQNYLWFYKLPMALKRVQIWILNCQAETLLHIISYLMRGSQVQGRLNGHVYDTKNIVWTRWSSNQQWDKCIYPAHLGQEHKVVGYKHRQKCPMSLDSYGLKFLKVLKTCTVPTCLSCFARPFPNWMKPSSATLYVGVNLLL